MYATKLHSKLFLFKKGYFPLFLIICWEDFCNCSYLYLPDLFFQLKYCLNALILQGYELRFFSKWLIFSCNPVIPREPILFLHIFLLCTSIMLQNKQYLIFYTGENKKLFLIHTKNNPSQSNRVVFFSTNSTVFLSFLTT